MLSVTCVLEIQTQVLTVAHQECYPLRFLPCPIFWNKYTEITQNQQEKSWGVNTAHYYLALIITVIPEVDLPSSVFLISVSPGFHLHCDRCDSDQIMCCFQEHPLGGRQLKVIYVIYGDEAIFFALCFRSVTKLYSSSTHVSPLSQSDMFLSVLRSKDNLYATFLFLKNPDSLSHL